MEQGGGSEVTGCRLASSPLGGSPFKQRSGYLDEGLHIAVKQLMVIDGAWSRLSEFLRLRGEGWGPRK